MPIHKVVAPVDNTQLSRIYIPHISKNGDHRRISDARTIIKDGKTEELDFEETYQLNNNGIEDPKKVILKKSSNAPNSYTNTKGGIYVIDAQEENPSPSKQSNGVLVLDFYKKPEFPEGCENSASVNDIPLLDQGSTPWCALITSLSQIMARLGVAIDIDKTMQCSIVPCEDSYSSEDFSNYSSFNEPVEKVLAQRRVTKFIEQECRSIKDDEERKKCENRLKTRFIYIYEDPLGNSWWSNEDLNDDVGARLKQTLHGARIRGRWFLALSSESNFNIVVACQDPEDQCLQNLSLFDEEDCEGNCSDLCTQSISINPVYHQDGNNISTNAILNQLCQGRPVMINLNATDLFRDRFIKEARKYNNKYPDGPPGKYHGIDLDVFSEPIIELLPEQDLIGGSPNHAVLLDGVQLLDNGYLIVRIRNSWGTKPFVPQFYTIAIPPGVDLGKIIKVGSVINYNNSSKLVIDWRVSPSGLDYEEICNDCGESISPCPTVTPTISVTPTPSTSIAVTPTPSTSTAVTPTPSTSTAVTPTPSTSTAVTPTPSVSETLTPTPTPTPTVTPSISETPTPSVTPSVSPTSESTPTPSIN